MNKKLSAWESFWYYLTVITSFGAMFGLKVVIKKAILEATK